MGFNSGFKGLRPDKASLPTGLGRNNSNIVEIICGWRQLYQCCAQLSSRFRLDNETTRKSGRVKTVPDGEWPSVRQPGNDGILITV